MDDNGKLNEKKIVEDIYKKAQLEEKIARSCIAESKYFSSFLVRLQKINFTIWFF